jgi:hypothetical protein
MKILARSVLAMEAITMGFALLLARLDSSGVEIAIGSVIAVALFLSAGLLRLRFGWWLAWALQFAMIFYGFVISAMFIMGAIFMGLWIAAIYFGRKGEAIRAQLIAESGEGEQKAK